MLIENLEGFKENILPYLNFTKIEIIKKDNVVRVKCGNEGVAQITYVFIDNKLRGLVR